MNIKGGFTIVELMIVIVVIGVLASITIVSYNGSQARAKTVQETKDIQNVADALDLYKTNVGNMHDGVAGAGGAGYWYGGSNTVYAGATKSMRQALIDAGYLRSNDTTNFMVALCTNTSDETRVVLGKFTTPPSSTPAQQISPTVCTSSSFSLYTDPAQNYKMNYAKVVQ